MCCCHKFWPVKAGSGRHHKGHAPIRIILRVCVWHEREWEREIKIKRADLSVYTHTHTHTRVYICDTDRKQRGFQAFEVQPYTQCSGGARGLMKVPTSPLKGLYVVSFHCCMLWFCTAWISQQASSPHVLRCSEHCANKDITWPSPSCWQCQLTK